MILPSWQSNVQACPAHMFGKHEDLDTSQGSDDSLFEQRGMKSSSACNHMRATTMHNDRTMSLLINLDLSRQKAKTLATKLCCQALQRLTTIIHTRHDRHLQGASRIGCTRRTAVEKGRRRAWASRSMADDSPDPNEL
eukprot:scaffold10199_cov28-Tisochrysis_lutea.AAC.2